MMKLYYSPGACSLASHIVLEEVKQPFEAKKVENFESPEFLKLNPLGVVPVLEIEPGNVLTEGVAILQYLADLKPDLKLAPALNSFERYRLQEMLNFIATEVHKGFSPLFSLDEQSQDPGVKESLQHFWIERLASRIELLSARLKDDPYLLGKQYSVADAYLFTVLRWARAKKLDLSRWPVIPRYQERIAAREAVQRAMLREGLIKAPSP